VAISHREFQIKAFLFRYLYCVYRFRHLDFGGSAYISFIPYIYSLFISCLSNTVNEDVCAYETRTIKIARHKIAEHEIARQETQK